MNMLTEPANGATSRQTELQTALAVVRDALFCLGLLGTAISTATGFLYYASLFGELHVNPADLLNIEDVALAGLRHAGLFAHWGILFLAVTCILTACLSRKSVQATLAGANRNTLRRNRRAADCILATLVLALVIVCIASTVGVVQQGKADAAAYRADAREFRGDGGCRTLADVDGSAPWSDAPHSCVSLVGVFAERAVFVAERTTYVIAAARVRAFHFNTLPNMTSRAVVTPGTEAVGAGPQGPM